MPTIIYQVAASMDGYIADADGGVDWLPDSETDDYGYEDFYAGVVALVMGRRTYDQAVGFDQWLFSGKPVYVFTGHPPDDNPHDVQFVQGDPADFVRVVAAQYDGMVWLLGGAALAEQFRRADLIDEYMIHVMPTILGRGVPLFSDAPQTSTRPSDHHTRHSSSHTRHSSSHTRHSRESGNPPATHLELIATQSFNDGAVMLHYRRTHSRHSGLEPESGGAG